MRTSEEALDKVFAALNELFLAELVKLGEPAAEAITRTHAAGGKIRFEIELPGSLTCSIQRGDHARVIVFHADDAPGSTFVSAPKDN